MILQTVKSWYRWQTNAARLARSGGSKVALEITKTLSGGDEFPGRAPQEVEVYSKLFYNGSVKTDADAAIKAENITTRGKMLSKRKDITRAKYAVEDDNIRAEVQAKHQTALAEWKEKRELAKAGFVQELDEDSKTRYIHCSI